MKMLIAAMLAVATLVGSTALASSSIWEQKWVNNYGVAMRYSLDMQGSSCQVNEMKDGTLEVIASDYNFYGSTAFQIAKIYEHGVVQVTYRGTMKTMANGMIQERDGGYDVFWVKCRALATSLPVPVREKFHGSFSVR